MESCIHKVRENFCFKSKHQANKHINLINLIKCNTHKQFQQINNSFSHQSATTTAPVILISEISCTTAVQGRLYRATHNI